jgi:hypothetical protein
MSFGASAAAPLCTGAGCADARIGTASVTPPTPLVDESNTLIMLGSGLLGVFLLRRRPS